MSTDLLSAAFAASMSALVACAPSAETGASASGTPPTDAAPPAVGCSAASATGIEVASTDVFGGPPYALGYPPYAVDGCRLAYVAGPSAGAQAGALVLRDLHTGGETLVAPATESPRRPSLAGALLAWEATVNGTHVVRVRSDGASTDAATITTVEGPFDHAGEPRATPDAVVLTAWLTPDDSGDTDIYLFTPDKPLATAMTTSAGQQRFADVSATHIAYTDFAEDPDGRFDENFADVADIVLLERGGSVVIKRERDGKQAFPLLGSPGKVGYLEWGPDHPEPKFSQYDLVIGDVAETGLADMVAASIMTAAPYIRPAAHGELFEWVQWPGGDSASLYRRPADLSEPPTLVPGLDGLALFGPSASPTLTVLAAREAGGAMILRAAER